MNTARKRILYFIENQGIKPSEFLASTGLKKGAISRSHVESGMSDLSLAKILDAYPEMNAHWLLTGQGDVIIDENAAVEKINNAIPHYEMEPGQLEKLLSGTEKPVPLGYYVIPGFQHCSHAFTMYGNSMAPKINNGEVCFFKEVEDKTLIDGGSIYLVTTDEFNLVRTIRRTDDPGVVSLVPSSPDYDPLEIPLDKINHLYRYHGKLCREEI